MTEPKPHPQPTRLLIVDDDASICAAYEKILGDHGYTVHTAGSRLAALSVVEDVGAQIDVLILDISLPDADGDQLAVEIDRRIGPRPTLYVSGWNEEFWDLTSAPTPWLVMHKPIPIPKLLAAIDHLAGRLTSLPPDF